MVLAQVGCEMLFYFIILKIERGYLVAAMGISYYGMLYDCRGYIGDGALLIICDKRQVGWLVGWLVRLVRLVRLGSRAWPV
jgi:hypothetical protein